MLWATGLCLCASVLLAQQERPRPVQDEKDPFADLTTAASAVVEQQPPVRGNWWKRLANDNLGFRKEILSQFDTTAGSDPNGASRQSVGFEIQKKFSTATETVASVDFQGRFVRRDGYNPVSNEMDARLGWVFEYHNLFADFYNVFKRSGRRVNFRIGRFYTPFGLNLATDTHGTVLQLSNMRNFGFERDWYAGFWGALSRNWKYDVYYLTGSGYGLKFHGQGGLGAVRLSLADRFLSEYGIEGGVSALAGRRLDDEANMRLERKAGLAVETERIGIDGRYRRPVRSGTVTWLSELSGGKDQGVTVVTQLHQAEYLRSSRRWGLAAQYQRFVQQNQQQGDATIAAEFTWYFRNDVGSSNLHWIKWNVAYGPERLTQRPRTVMTLEYYFYK